MNIQNYDENDPISKKTDTEYLMEEKIFYEPTSSLTENLSIPYQVSQVNGLGLTQNTEMAIDKDSNIHVVWADKSDGDLDIIYRFFNYSSQLWENEVNLTESSNDQAFPTVATDQDCNVWVIWVDNPAGNADLVGRFYNATLNAWESANIISSGGSGNQLYTPHLANWDGINFTLVYTRYFSTHNIIRYKSITIGESWSSASEYGLDITDKAEKNPYVYFDSNNKGHLVFVRDDRIIYCNMTYDGTDYKFGLNNKYLDIMQNLNPDNTTSADYPTIVVNTDMSQIYVAWQDRWLNPSQRNIRFVNLTYTTDIENILDDEIQNITENTNDNYFPRLALGPDNKEPSIIWIKSNSEDLILKRNLTSSTETYYDDSVQSNEPKHVPCLVSDNNNSLHSIFISWDENGYNQVFYRKYDFYGPQLKFISPQTDGLYFGNVSLEVETERDTVNVSYEYYDDTDADGIANDGNSWELIKKITSLNGNFYWEWNTTDGGAVDYLHILVRANATDVNGLNESIIHTNITIDNHEPNIVELLDINDYLGHYLDNSSGNGYVRGNVVFNFNAEDLATRVDYVELWNGSSLIGNNNTGYGNNTAIEIDTTSGVFDGNYSDLYIKAYDIVGMSNISYSFAKYVIIDNTNPIPTINDIIFPVEYSRDIIINVTTFESDTNTVNLYYYIHNGNPDSAILIGSASYSDGVWSITWDTEGSTLSGNYTIIAEVTDMIGLTTNVTQDINLDNTLPSPIIISPIELIEVGDRVVVNISSDLDTVLVSLWNSTELGGPYEYYANTTEYIIEGNRKIFTIIFDAIDIPKPDNHHLRANATDNQGFFNISSERIIRLREFYPDKIRSFVSKGIVKDEESNTYNITIEWLSPLEDFQDVDYYVIFKIRADTSIFDIQLINEMDSIEKFEYLGNFEGQKYYAKYYDVDFITEGQGETYQWIDTGNHAATYYYMIFAVNRYGNPSDCSSILEVTIPAENPEYKANTSEIQAIPYIFLGYVAIVAVFAKININSKKDKKIKIQRKETLESMYEEKFTDDGEKSLEERLDEMETVIEKTAKKKKAKKIKSGEVISEIEAPKTKEDDFLDLKISSEETTTRKEPISDGPRRCPNCNWMLSSKAIKCPRCGELV